MIDIARNLYFLDGMDVVTTFGLLVKKGSADFLRFPKKKASIEHDWINVSGIDVDLSQIFFEANEGTLECAMIADTEADFLTKHDRLFALFGQPGLRRLTITAHGGRSYFVHYVSCTNYVQVKAMRGIPANQVIHSFNLTLREPMPQLAPVETYIGTEDNAFLIT